MRILFAGFLSSPAETSWQRYDTLRRLGHDVEGVDQTPYCDLRQRWLLRRFDGKAFTAENIAALNTALIGRVRKADVQVVWIEKGLLVLPETLLEIKTISPATRLIAYQDDNPFGRRAFERSFWKCFVDTLPLYDLHFVKRQSDVAEFRSRKVDRIAIFTTGYYEPTYGRSSGQGPREFRRDVTFVGTAIDDRGTVLGGLLRSGVDVHVYGTRWERCWSYYCRRGNFHTRLPPAEHADLIWRSRVNLGLVSHSNLDEYNGRSFDIPASAGFLLAERTPAHMGFYKEGHEAEFFTGIEELVEKTKYYLSNETARAKIARRGYERCISEDYSLSRRMRDAIARVKALW